MTLSLYQRKFNFSDEQRELYNFHKHHKDFLKSYNTVKQYRERMKQNVKKSSRKLRCKNIEAEERARLKQYILTLETCLGNSRMCKEVFDILMIEWKRERE
jgi:hypothetical protein